MYFKSEPERLHQFRTFLINLYSKMLKKVTKKVFSKNRKKKSFALARYSSPNSKTYVTINDLYMVKLCK